MEDVLIAPSVLAADLMRLGSELESVSSADYVHYDVMDGHFVPNLSFGPDMLRQVVDVSRIPVDCHLMISNPDTEALRYVRAGASIVSFHLEATAHAHRLAYAIRDVGARAGIAICPATPVSALDAIIEDVDLVLVMSVNPGFGGQSFIEGTHRKLRELSRLCAERGVRPLVEVDGGIGPANAEAVCASGANMLVAGSSVFGEADRLPVVEALREAGRSGIARRS